MGKTYQTTLLIRGDSKNAVREVSLTRQELERLTGAQSKSVPLTGRMSAAFSKANKSVGNLTRGLQGFGGLLATIGVVSFARKTLESADSLASMRGQLKLVTDSQEELNDVYARALTLSNQTGQATESTVNLYARMARSTKELKLTQNELFTITKAVNQSFVVSGASATESGSAILQLSQGLASGALRGEELNSVMENSPRLARALADGLGVSIGQLREMGKEGQLTAEAVTGALLKMADEIDGEFKEMPMTVGRSMQALTNSVNDALGDVDTSELTTAVGEAQKLIADPQFKQAVGDLATALVNLTSFFAKAVAGAANFARFIGEELARSIHGVAFDDLPGMEAELAKLETRLAGMPRGLTRNAKATKELRAEIQELTKRIEIKRKEDAQAAAAARKHAEAKKTAEDAARALREESERLTAVLAENNEVVADAQGRWTVVQGVWEENDRLMREIVKSGSEVQTTMKGVASEADPMAAAIERGAERVDDSVSRMFTDFVRTGKLSMETVKDTFLNTLGEMAYAAARNKIFVGIGLGGSSAGALASGGGLMSGVGGIRSSLLSGIGGFGSGVFNAVGQGASFLADLGLPGMDALSTAAFGRGMTTTGLGTLANAGAGLAGGLLGNTVFGPTSGIGSAIGGIGGAIFGGPIGSAIGSFLGSGLESLIGNSQPSDKTGTALLDLASGGVTIGGLSGSKFSQENRDAAGQIASQFSAFASVLGGSSGSLDIGVGNRDGLRLDGRDYGKDIEGFLDAGFAKIIAGAENLDPALKSLIANFDGSAEEITAYAGAVMALSDAANVNVVQDARDAWQELTDGQRTATSVYYQQSDALRTLIQDYDGSAAATQNLNGALAASRSMAQQLAVAILQTSDQISSLSENSAQFIRQSVMSESELREARQSESRSILQSLNTLSDPDELKQAFARFEELNKQIFQSLSPERQETDAEFYATRIETANELFQSRLEDTLASIQATEDDTNAQINQLLIDGAQQMNEAAFTMNNAAANFGGWVQQLISQGINVNLGSLGGETETVT